MECEKWWLKVEGGPKDYLDGITADSEQIVGVCIETVDIDSACIEYMHASFLLSLCQL